MQPTGRCPSNWIIYRIYVANKGSGRNAGVPLPTITLVGQDGRSYVVPPCRSLQALDMNAAFPSEWIASLEQSTAQQASCQETPLVVWIPKNTGGYFPNPANKYIAIPGVCFQPNRILVVRGKGPAFPDTYNGGPIWQPAGVQLRCWSLCNNDQRLP
jgi:hypothetical protein